MYFNKCWYSPTNIYTPSEVRRRKSTKSPRSHPKICYYSAYKCLDGIISICRDHNYFWAYDRGAAECFWYASQHLQSGAVRLPRKQKQHGKRTSLQHRRTQVCVSAESPGHRELSARGRSKQAAAPPTTTTTTTPPGTSQQFLCLSLHVSRHSCGERFFLYVIRRTIQLFFPEQVVNIRIRKMVFACCFI